MLSIRVPAGNGRCNAGTTAGATAGGVAGGISIKCFIYCQKLPFPLKSMKKPVFYQFIGVLSTKKYPKYHVV